jgi:glycosyltransferase involved in cell wall biosynthesis
MSKFLPLDTVNALFCAGNKEDAISAISFMEQSKVYPDSLKERLDRFGRTRWQATFDSKKIIIVLHDLEVGGAQDLMLSFGEWLKTRTQYSPVFIAMRTGTNFRRFTERYPTLVLDCSPENTLANCRLVSEFIAQHNPVLGIVNSVASGKISQYVSDVSTIPWYAYVHELHNLLDVYRDNLSQLNVFCNAFIAGSPAVSSALASNPLCTLPIHICEAFIDWRKVWVTPNPNLLVNSNIIAHKVTRNNNQKKIFKVAGCGTVHWRKDPILFIETALHLLHNSKLNDHYKLEFVWYGSGPDLATCQDIVAATPFSDRINFLGHSDNLLSDFIQSDLLLLCSTEDPFPLTAIQAGVIGLPIVTIDGSGGIADLLKVNHLPMAASRSKADLAEQIIDLIVDDDYYASISIRTKKLFTQNFTSLTQARQLFLLVTGLAGYSPLVSVILPNYNCATFLEKRLYTILFQTFQDFEVIILDDASTDNSRKLLKELSTYNRYDKLIFNEINSGSVFSQWKLGIENAKGTYIWIAESDDFADLHFLDSTLSSLLLNNSSFAYSNSVPVDTNGLPYGDYRDLYLDQFNPGKWDVSYNKSGSEEISSSLGVANTIPNASSTIFQRNLITADDLIKAMDFKMCGDWFIYILLCSRGDISFVQSCNNYHTRHASSSSFSTEKTNVYFKELNKVYSTINNLFGFDHLRSLRQITHLFKEYERFGFKVDDYSIDLSTFFINDINRPALPTVAYIVSDLSPGGGQLIQIRIADAYIKNGGLAILLNLNVYESHTEVIKSIPTYVPLLNSSSFTPETLPPFLQRLGIKVIHSSLWWADKFSYYCFGNHPFVLISSMHGCYETLDQSPDIDPLFKSLLPDIISRFDGFIFTSEKHKALLTSLGQTPNNETFIFNGYEQQKSGNNPIQLRDKLGLDPKAKILLLATRAVEGKGWDVAIKSLKYLAEDSLNYQLLLIGDGPLKSSMISLVHELELEKSVYFIGHASQLVDYISLADVCLLPTTFIGESMPLVLIEYLAQAKAVITTDMGSIPLMLQIDANSSAGIVLDSKCLTPHSLATAIVKVFHDNHLMNQLQSKSARAFMKFNMNQCINSHLKFYNLLGASSEHLQSYSKSSLFT